MFQPYPSIVRISPRPVRALPARALRARPPERALSASVALSACRRLGAMRHPDDRAASARQPRGERSHPPASPRRELARGHDREPARSPPRHHRARARAPAACPSRSRRSAVASSIRTSLSSKRRSRSTRGFGRAGSGRWSRSRLHRLKERFSRHRQPAPSAPSRRGVRAPGRAPRRGGPGRLGPLR